VLVDRGVLKGLEDEFEAAVESVAAAANDRPDQRSQEALHVGQRELAPRNLILVGSSLIVFENRFLEVSPEDVDGDAKVLRRHVVEPHGRDEEHVFRPITNWVYSHKSAILFKDLRLEVEAEYIEQEARLNKWIKVFPGPDNNIFGVVMCLTKTHRWGYVIVLGGKREAKKYRSKMRVSSEEMDVSVVHNGPGTHY